MHQVEEEIAALKKEQQRIEDNVRKMEEKMGSLGIRPAYLDPAEGGREKKEGDNDDEDGDKKDKKSRSRSRSRSRDRDRRGKKPDPRAKALFKALVGHLGAARSRLNKDADSALKMQEVKRKELEAAKERSELKVAEVLKQINEKELVLLQHKLEHHYTLMGNFIKTKASPTIFYLPAKQTEETEKLLEETREVIDKKISALKDGAIYYIAVPAEKSKDDDDDADDKQESAAKAPATSMKDDEDGADAAPADKVKEDDEDAKDDEENGQKDDKDDKSDDSDDDEDGKD